MKENIDTGCRILHYLLNEEREPKDPALIEWLGESESNKRNFCRYKRIWNESKYYIEASAFDPGAAWKKINRINKRKERISGRLHPIYYTLSGVAAAVIAALTLSIHSLVNSTLGCKLITIYNDIQL
ncbi:MAG: hypothetical protein LBG28_04260 [Tannerella sp.]|jgi:hypothetical protein|nr:hypothetical protein [Tannerella sp.]